MAEWHNEPPGSEITPEGIYLRRRTLLRNAGLVALTATGVGTGLLALAGRSPRADAPPKRAGKPLALLTGAANAAFSTDEPRTSYADITHYNNFYELGLGKEEPARNASSLVTSPW